MGDPNGHVRFNFGDALHILEVAVLLISIGISYEKFSEAADQVRLLTDQATRIEHYLSSKDPEYWREVK